MTCRIVMDLDNTLLTAFLDGGLALIDPPRLGNYAGFPSTLLVAPLRHSCRK